MREEVANAYSDFDLQKYHAVRGGHIARHRPRGLPLPDAELTAFDYLTGRIANTAPLDPLYSISSESLADLAGIWSP